MLEPRSDQLQAITSLIPAKVIIHTPVKIEITVIPNASEEAKKHVHITTGTHLGEGAFGVVLGGMMTETWKQKDGTSADKTTEIAVKCSQKKVQRKDLDRLKEEVKTMSLFTHPNIVKYHFACTYHDYIYIIMEKCEKCNLHEAIKLYDGHLSMKDILFIGYQIVDALTYVHAMGCIHRDVKPGNFVFDQWGNIKLTDFGLSSMVHRPDSYNGVDLKSLPEHGEVKCENANRRTVAGTYSYMAPEIMKQVILHRKNKHMEKGFRYGVEVDVYSLGVLLFFLATRTSPYWNSIREYRRKDSPDKADSTRVLCEAVSEGKWQWPLSTKFRMESIDTDFRKLVESMLSFRGSERPTLSEIREHVLWKRRPQTISTKLLNIVRNGPEEGKVKKFPYYEVSKRKLEKLQQEEELIRSGFTIIRSHYCALMSLQGKELAQLANIISEHQRGLVLLKNRETEERTDNKLDNDLTFLGTHYINEREGTMSRKIQDDLENSGRYSFRASTLAAWSISLPSPKRSRSKPKPLDSSPLVIRQSQGAMRKPNAPRVVTPLRKPQSRAPEWNHTPKQRSLRSYHELKTSVSKVRRTPSFWLDGPSQKFTAVPSPTFDVKNNTMKCPKKHSMAILRKFPALNETVGGTNDYGWGFWCDNCHKEVPSLKSTRKRGKSPKVDKDQFSDPEKNTFFYHCHCGYDLCKACGASIMKSTDSAPTHESSHGNIDPARSEHMPVKEKSIATAPQLKILDQKENFAELFDMDIPSNEHVQSRPTFVPQEPQEPPSVNCYSPQPLPHSPSHIVDKRFPLIPLAQDPQSKQSLRMWWEPNSPFAQSHDTHAEASTYAEFGLPRPHTVMPDTFSQFNELLAESLVISNLRSPIDDTDKEEKPENKGKKYVNTIHIESENQPPKNAVEKPPKEIVNGYGWIWHYEIQQENNIIYILYMCSEECFGCLIMNTAASVQSAMIYDKSRHVVFFVPQIEQREMKGPSRNYTHPHPYIATHYKDSIIMFREIDVLRMSVDTLEEVNNSKSTPGRRNSNIKEYESFNVLPQYLSVLKGYVDGLESRKLPFDPPKNAKLFYLRKFFYDYDTDEEPQWYMFRLSNGHTVISSPKENTQIRWLAVKDTVPDNPSSAVVDKYIFQGDEVRLYENLEYFRKVRHTLQQFDGHSHYDL